MQRQRLGAEFEGDGKTIRGQNLQMTFFGKISVLTPKISDDISFSSTLFCLSFVGLKSDI